MKIRPGLIAALAAAVIVVSPVAAYAMAVSAGGGGPAAYTTSTSLTSLTENPSDCTATPGATPVQTGQVVGIPCTFPVTTTVVTSYTLHSPTPEYGPRPIVGYGPRPIVGYGPAPIIGYGPKPIIGYGPRPIVGYGPRPIVGYGPRPVIGYGPRPIVGYRTVQTGPYHRTIYHTETVKVVSYTYYYTHTCRKIDGGKDVICTFTRHSVPHYTTTTVQVPYTITYYLTSQVPVYGAAPPIYGAARPIYGPAPPLYGAAPPIYGPAPPLYGAAPPIYGAAPPIYGAAPIVGYSWTTSPDGTSTKTTVTYQQSLLFATPLGGGGGGGSGSGSGNCGPGHCGPYYIIPIPVSGN